MAVSSGRADGAGDAQLELVGGEAGEDGRERVGVEDDERHRPGNAFENE
jgi:hypothetical protein